MIIDPYYVRLGVLYVNVVDKLMRLSSPCVDDRSTVLVVSQGLIGNTQDLLDGFMVLIQMGRSRADFSLVCTLV